MTKLHSELSFVIFSEIRICLTDILLLPLEKLDWKPLDKNVLEDFFYFDEPEYNPTFKPEQ